MPTVSVYLCVVNEIRLNFGDRSINLIDQSVRPSVSACLPVCRWQGDKDSRDMGLSTQYEQNLVALIKQLRLQYNAPKAKFVTASLGQATMGSTGGAGLILDAMMNVANATKFPEFAGNVAAVYTNPLLHTPGSSGGHYGDDAYTYMDVGEAMGKAMIQMLKADEQQQ